MIVDVISYPSTANVLYWWASVAISSCTTVLPLRDISKYYPTARPTFGDLLEPTVDAKFILTPVLWKYLYHYARKHQALGNGFGYGRRVDPRNPQSVGAHAIRTLLHKDGAEILVDRVLGPPLGEQHFDDAQNQLCRPPCRLTPRECARLMGFESPQGYRFRHSGFRYPGLSSRSAIRWVVPVFAAVAKLLCAANRAGRGAQRESEDEAGGRPR